MLFECLQTIYNSLDPPEQISDDHLLPFGQSFGDQLLPPADDDSSEPQIKNDECPLFGVEEDTIIVSF